MSGVIGIYSKDRNDLSQIAYYGLYALQHRGQISCGMVVNNNDLIDYHKSLGLVQDVFSKETIEGLIGNIAIGHVRHTSENGGKDKNNVEPLAVGYKRGGLALSLDGSIVNSKRLRKELEEKGNIFQTDLDGELIANLIARYHDDNLQEAIIKVIKEISGSYSMTLMTSNKLIGARDPYGLKPLSLAKFNDCYILSSETCAFDTIGGEFIRDIEPGEVVLIDESGVRTIFHKEKKKSRCLFEYIYFARPDSRLDGISVYKSRYQAGRELYREHKSDADIVIGAPDSGIVGAIGYAKESKIPYAEGIIKNRYVGRTFIEPTQELREVGVRIKLNALNENIEGKKIILVDDSIVRGTTIKRTVDMLKKAGAKEVHVRIISPPITNPCYLGFDLPSKDDLIAARMSVEEIRDQIQADSLYYLSLEGLEKSIGGNDSFCRGCFIGQYPLENENLNKEEVELCL